MNLLLLISGNSKKIFQTNSFNENNFEIIKFEEKNLSNFKLALSIMNSKDYNQIVIGVQDLFYQRFVFLMLSYFLIIGKWDSSIVDENAKRVNFNIFSYLFRYIPLLIVELIVSGFMIIYFYLRVKLILWKTGIKS